MGSRVNVISLYAHPRERGYAPHWRKERGSGRGVNYREKLWGSARNCDCFAVRGDNPVAGAGVHGNVRHPIIINIDFESTRGEGVLKFYAALLRNRVSEISRGGGRRSDDRFPVRGHADGTSFSFN